MAPISLKIVTVLEDGAGTRTRKVKFDTMDTVAKAYEILKDKVTVEKGKDHGLFLRSADDDLAGVWLERHRNLDYYMLRDGDSLDYICKIRNLRIRMLDGAVKTMPVDQSKSIANLMIDICSRLGIINHDEYGLCREELEDSEESKEAKSMAGSTGTLTKNKAPPKEKDQQLEQLSKILKTDDNVHWLEHHKTLREAGLQPAETLLLKRRLFYSDRNVDSRDPVQLNLLYLQTRDAILNGLHPVTEDQAVDCKVRWINIRDVHRRICRKKAAQPNNKSKPYKYEKEMAFMQAFYKDVVPLAAPEEEDKNYEQWNDRALDSDTSDNSEEPIKKPVAKRRRTKRTLDRSYEEEEKPPSTSFNETQSEFDSSDPVDAFLLSIGASLKTFSPYHLNLAKTKIFSVVQEHDLQQIMEKQSNDVNVNVKIPPTETLYLNE